MQYSIKVNGVNIPNQPNLKALASLTFGNNEFVVNNIRLMEGEKGLYISFPSKMKYENGEPLIVDGKQQYRDFAFPTTKESYAEITNAIKMQYENHTTGQIYNYGEPMEYEVDARAYVPDNPHETALRGFASVKFGDNAFVVQDIRIYENSEGEKFVQMPNYMKAEGQYVDIAHPTTNAFRSALDKAILKQHEQQMNMANVSEQTSETQEHDVQTASKPKEELPEEELDAEL